MPDGPGHVLVLRALGLGDFLTGLPALRGLEAAFPDHRLTLAAPGWITPLARLSGVVEDVVEVGELEALPRVRPEIGVNLHGSGPQSHRLLLDTCPGRLIAFAHPEVPETRAFPHWEPEEHEVHRWCRLLEEFSIPCDPTALDLPAPEPAPPARRRATIVHPGAKSAARRWPPDRWVEVVKAELASNRTVLLTGNAAERELCEWIAKAAQLAPDRVVAGTTDLLDLASLVASADRVVSGDTGVAHLATAYRTPSVILFGPTPPHLWGPPPDRPQHRTIWKGHRGDPLGDAPDAGILAIAVDEVLGALEGLPARSLTAP